MAMLRMMNKPIGEHEEHPDDASGGYTCPMHPEVRRDHPGRCPKCGMDLVPSGSGRQQEAHH